MLQQARRREEAHILFSMVYWLCLSELPLEVAEPEIVKHKDEMLESMTKSMLMNSETYKVINPVRLCALRNCLSRLPEYAYITERQPYVSKGDGRLHFDMKPSTLLAT